MIYDISPLLSPRIKVWPGDTPLDRQVLLDMNRGDNLTLSTLTGTVHMGSHADAPSHYGATAKTIEQQPLELYLGPCQVVRVEAELSCRFGLEQLVNFDAIDPTERLLLSTGTYPDPDLFSESFAALDPELVDALADRGVRLIGTDTPSVDLFSSKTLPAHRRCLEREVAILEGLVLNAVPPGRYELIALPLKLEGFDASPVRAVLRDL